jgi:arsenate reductase
MKIKIYQYNKCSTCVKAIKYLDSKKIPYESIAIVDQPPSTTELKKMLSYLKNRGGTFKNLFNTSGVQYRELKISEKMKAGLTESDAIKLLSTNGKLIKRPFLLTDSDGAVGFDQKLWTEIIDAT